MNPNRHERPDRSFPVIFLIFIGLYWPSSSRELLLLPFLEAWVGVASLVVALWLTWTEKPRATVILVAIFLPLAALGLWRSCVTEDDLVEYVAEFDESLDELIRWEHMGRVAGWLQARGHDVDVARQQEAIREAIRVGVRVHPSSLKGAIAAGVLGPDEWRALAGGISERARRRILGGKDAFVWTLGQPVDLRVLIEAGDLHESERAHLVQRLAVSWPVEQGIGNLEDTREITELLLRLDAADRIQDHRDAIRDMLVRSWSAEGPDFGPGGGFSVRDTGENHRGDDEAGSDAIELMLLVGVPDEIDLDLFEAHLRAESQRGLVSFYRAKVYRHDLLTYMSLLRLRTDLSSQRTTSVQTVVRRWQVPCAMGLLLLFIVICSPRRTDESEEAEVTPPAA